MAGLHTREAAQARDAAREAWRGHRQLCSQCELAARSRHPRGMCPMGRAINTEYAQAEAEYRKEKAADAQADPNKGTLIDIMRP